MQLRFIIYSEIYFVDLAYIIVIYNFYNSQNYLKSLKYIYIIIVNYKFSLQAEDFTPVKKEKGKENKGQHHKCTIVTQLAARMKNV